MSWTSKATEGLWLAAAVALPLVFNPWGYNAFELPKTAVLRLLTLLMVLAALAQVVEGKPGPAREKRVPRALLWPALTLGLAVILATALSVNPRASLWGSYERQQGLITWGGYLVLFLHTTANLRTFAQADRLWSAIVWGSAPVVAYGLMQAVGIDPFVWRSDAASPILSTLGRANFFGSYLVLVVPLTVGRAMAAGRPWLYAPLLAGQLTCLALTQARGAWVGLGVAAVTFGLIWAIMIRSRWLALATLITAGVVVAFVVMLNWAGGPLAPLAEMPGLDRLAALSHTDSGSSAARLTIWRATLPLVADRAWLGYGPETMRVVFARVFPPELVYYQGRHIVVDRAHNLWLDLGMSTGLFGAVAFGALMVGFGRLAWTGLRDAQEHWQRILWAALLAGIAGHLADLQFSFELTGSASIFWLSLALAGALGRGLTKEPATKAEEAERTVNLLALLPPAVAALVLAGMVCARPLLADLVFWRAGEAPAIRAVRLWPLEPEYRLGLAQSYVKSGNLVAAEAQLSAAERLSPDDPRVWSARGDLYLTWGAMNPGRYGDAEAAYRHALGLAPNVAAYHTALAVILERQGRLDEGIVALEQAVALDATDSVAYGYLAELYAAAGRDREAAWAQREAERWKED